MMGRCYLPGTQGMASATQQLLNTVHWGLARGLGAAVGGRILARSTGETMFMVGAAQSVSS